MRSKTDWSKYRPMWTCPNCHQKFVNINQSHSCGSFTVEEFLEGKTETAIRLYHYFLNEYRKIGDFELHPVKTRIALVKQMRFCAINKLGKDFISIHLVLAASYADSPVFYKIDNLGDRFFIHHLKIKQEEDITGEVRKFMRLAYAV